MEKHLNQCVETLQKKYGEERVIFVGYYGAHNYSLETPQSDYDFKAIVVPSFEEIVLNRDPVSKTMQLEDGQCDVKDIRVMMQCWKKQNINFVELLFTDFNWFNSTYEALLAPLFTPCIRERIVHYDEKKALSCMRGLAKQKYHALRKPYPSQQDVIEKYGYSAKQFTHLVRVKNLLISYLAGAPYKECLQPAPSVREYLIALKTYDIVYMSQEIEELAKKELDMINYIVDNAAIRETKDIEIEKLMNKITTDVLREALRGEIT